MNLCGCASEGEECSLVFTTSPFQVLVLWLASIHQVVQLTTSCLDWNVRDSVRYRIHNRNIWRFLKIDVVYLLTISRVSKIKGQLPLQRAMKQRMTGWFCGFIAETQMTSVSESDRLILIAKSGVAPDYQQCYEREKTEMVLAVS